MTGNDPKEVRIVIKGRIPSKKNSRQQITLKGKNGKRGRTINIPSAAYKEWNRYAIEQVEYNLEYKLPHFEKCEGVTLTFFMPDNRRCDLTNKAESVMDMLVDCGILKDDCWQVTGPVHLIAMGVDKAFPRVVIEIKESIQNMQGELL